MLHIAIYQKGDQLENQVRELLSPEEVIFHQFSTFQQLAENPRRYELDLIIFATKRDIAQVIKLLTQIFKDIILSLPPKIIILPLATKNDLTRCYKAGADEMLALPLDN